jgi:hypothetical protein
MQIVSSCAIPEDKPIETALMLFSAAILLSPKATTMWRGLGAGAILSLSILFKLFGVFLFPLWLVRTRAEWPKFGLWTILGGLVPLGLSFAVFGPYFIETMMARGARDSFGVSQHASPWALFPLLSGNALLTAKIIVVSIYCSVLLALLAKRRIDMLNFCAGIAVAFACIWLIGGSLNRINITILFSIGAMASLSSWLFFYFSSLAMLISGVSYAVGMGLFAFKLEAVDRVLVLVFVCAYLLFLASLSFRKSSGSGMEPHSATTAGWRYFRLSRPSDQDTLA